MVDNNAATIFGIVAGIIGMLVAIPYCFIYNRLPSKRIHYLESMHSETKKLFDTAVEEGLIDDDADIALIHKTLWRVMIDIDKARMEVYNTHTIWQDFRHWRRGVSQDISKHCNSLQKIRAKISERTSMARRLREAACYEAGLARLSNLKRASTFPLEKTGTGVTVSALPPDSAFVPADTVSHMSLDSEKTLQDPPTNATRGLLHNSLSHSRRVKAERRHSMREVLVRLGQELAASHVPGAVATLSHGEPTTNAHGSEKASSSAKKHRWAPLTKVVHSFRRTSGPRPAEPRSSPQHPRSHSCCDSPFVIHLTPDLLDALETSDESDYDDEEDSGDEKSCDLDDIESPV